MGAIKDAIYQIDNGVDFDEIHFKTKASQVTLKDSSNYFTATDVEGAMKELFQNVSSGKSSIATAITGKGVSASGSDTFAVLASKIGQISTGKKWAEGTSSSSGTTKTGFQWAGNLNVVQDSYITIPLDFRPSYIVAMATSSGSDYLVVLSSSPSSIHSPSVKCGGAYGDSSNSYQYHYNYKADSRVFLDNNIIRLPLGNNISVIDYKWIAFE